MQRIVISVDMQTNKIALLQEVLSVLSRYLCRMQCLLVLFIEFILLVIYIRDLEYCKNNNKTNANDQWHSSNIFTIRKNGKTLFAKKIFHLV